LTPIAEDSFTVALPGVMFKDRANCGKELTITANGKTLKATVANECP
jgi:hypothetical protein